MADKTLKVRKLWAEFAAIKHGRPNSDLPEMSDNGNGLQFSEAWHEEEFRTFEAGFNCALIKLHTRPLF